MTEQKENDFSWDANIITDQDSIDVLKKKNQDLQALLGKVIDLLKEKTNVCLNLEKQNSALNLQVNYIKYCSNYSLSVKMDNIFFNSSVHKF